jgi:hypothetical protein
MDEQEMRDLTKALHDELEHVIDDGEERRRTAAEIEAALTLPEGAAKEALLTVLLARPQTRLWAAARTGADEDDLDRAISGLPGAPTAPLGVHVICPNGDYDRYLESPTDDPGRCPYDGRKLVRASD